MAGDKRENWLVRYNVGYKILAVCLAFLLWYFVTGQRDPMAKQTFTRPVELRPTMTQLVSTTPLPEVTITVSGAKSLVQSLQEQDIHAYVDVSGQTTGVSYLPIQTGVPDNIQVLSIYPQTVRVSLDYLADKKVPVKVVLQGTPALRLHDPGSRSHTRPGDGERPQRTARRNSGGPGGGQRRRGKHQHHYQGFPAVLRTQRQAEDESERGFGGRSGGAQRAGHNGPGHCRYHAALPVRTWRSNRWWSSRTWWNSPAPRTCWPDWPRSIPSRWTSRAPQTGLSRSGPGPATGSVPGHPGAGAGDGGVGRRQPERRSSQASKAAH